MSTIHSFDEVIMLSDGTRQGQQKMPYNIFAYVQY